MASLNLGLSKEQRIEQLRKDYLGTSDAPPKTAMKPNGSFLVEIKTGDNWVKAGSLQFDQFVREQALELPASTTSTKILTLRISKNGGGAAHLDSVTIGNNTPLGITPGDNNSLRKLAAKDFDLLDAAKPLELLFPAGSTKLTVSGRIEAEIISTNAFMVPRQNYCTNIDSPAASFLPYSFDNKDTGKQDISTLEKERPFIREFLRSGSGHPSEYLSGWVKNDLNNLYVTLDFAGDNTLDGDKDFAKVFTKVGNKVREFKLTENDPTWGRARFEYTGSATWQHKLYEFQIPLTEIGAASLDEPVQLAFSTYGTCAAGDLSKTSPNLVHDPITNR